MKIFLVLAASLLALPALAATGDVSGTVVESMNSGGYTYLLIKTASGEQQWAAVAKTKVAAGAAATVTGVMEMKNFESPTLKRKFDRIYFGNLAEGAAKGGALRPHGGNASPHGGTASPHGTRAEVKGPIKVAKAAGPDARTVAEIHAQKTALQGKEVVLAGKVVKYNAAILDRNWAHLRDGSGSAKDGSDDLTVVLKDESALGRVITVRGKVVLKKDLGASYQFPVLLEDAVLVK